MAQDPRPTASLRHRLLWFAGLWLAGVAVVAGVAWLLRTLLF